ncbi:MAG: serine hydrolase domain-containing protein [Geminicoccaceae bacterium]
MTPSAMAAPLSDPWTYAEPQDLGFDPGLGDKLEAGIRSGLLPGLHSVLVVRSGKIVLERYCEGEDENWGRPLGRVSFGPDTLHDLRSITKSVVSLLYGIALDRGVVPPPEAPLLAQFPEYPELAADPERAAIRIEHALTMTLGTEWNEWLPYTDPANSEIMMERAEDRYRFILERPVVNPPGERWVYNGGCTALIARLIVKGSGQTLAAFADQALFKPLGIETFEWRTGSDGIYSAASGLRLTPRAIARIGLLALAGGKWGDEQIVSADWLDRSFKPAIDTGEGLDYGRFWWLAKDYVPGLGEPKPWMAGFGNGGQRLWIMPAADLCAVVTAGKYYQPDDWVYPTRVWREIVLANLMKA